MQVAQYWANFGKWIAKMKVLVYTSRKINL